MGYNDNCVVKVDQEFFQPCDCIKIQVVGRLVKKQDIRVSEQCLCKKNLDLLRTCQVFHQFIMKFCLDTKSVQKVGSIRFCFPSIHCSELSFQLTCFDSVFICEIFFCVNFFFLFHDFIQTCISHDNCIKNREFVIFEMILLKERKSLARGDNYITGCRLKLSGKNLKKCRFTGTVRTDHSVAVPFCEFDVNIFEQRLFPDAKGYVICTNHLKVSL